MKATETITRDTTIPDVKIHVFVHDEKGADHHYIRAYLQDNSGKRIGSVKEVKFDLLSSVDKDRLMQQAEKLLIHQYRKLTEAYSASSGSTTCMLKQAYRELADKTVLENGWSAHYSKQMQSYFSRQVLPRMDSVLDEDGHITDSRMNEIALQLKEESFGRKRSYKDDASTSRFQSLLATMNDMIKRFYNHAFPSEIEVPQFNIGPRIRAHHREQRKWLRQEVRDRLSQLLLKSVVLVPMALCAALMFCGGLRTSEAAAVKFGQIQLCGRYAILYVEFQVGPDGERSDIEKTEQGYRVVVLPYFFVALFQARVAHLKSTGKTDDEIASMYFCDFAATNSSNLSAFCKGLLTEAGLTSKEEKTIIELITREPDMVDKVAVKDPSAYILRRDWATRAAACGMTPADLDYFIGHMPYEEKRKNKYYGKYLNSQKWDPISLVNEKYVYHPDLSFHPQFCPICVRDNVDITLDTNCGYRIRNNCDHPIQINARIHGTEPGSKLEITAPKKPRKKESSSKCVEDTLESRKERFVPFFSSSQLE